METPSSADTAEQDDQVEDHQLSMWLNSRLDPDSSVSSTLLEGKLQLHVSLLDECRRVKCRLEEGITWARFLSASVTKQDWTRRLNASIESYRECWLKLALLALKRLFCAVPENSGRGNLGSTAKQTIRLIVSASGPKWNQAAAVRFLTLVYFLDRAKHKVQVWEHQPSLFVRNCASIEPRSSVVSSSEQIISHFVLTCLSAGMGGQFKAELRAVLYQLEHAECDAEMTVCFAVKNLSTDLADGVRLAKLAEILFQHENVQLVKWLKYPAKRSIDRVANMTYLFDSFLWSKLMHYDSKQWLSEKMPEMATRVANSYRDSTIRLLKSLRELQLKLVLEHHYQPQLLRIITIQRRVKEWHKSRRLRTEYLRLRQVTIWVQQRYRSKLAARRVYTEFLQLKAAVVFVQKQFRLRRNVKVVRQYVDEFVARQRQAAITIQRHWRGVLTRWRARSVYKFDLMDIVTRIELKAATTGVRPTIATKVDQLLRRLEASGGQGDIKRMLQNSGAVTKLLGDLQLLSEYAYYVLEVRVSVLQYNSAWVLVHFAKVLPRLNRSEHHKSIAHHILAILNCLAKNIRMKSIPVVEINSSIWCELAKSLIQLMHDYINYPLLVRELIATMYRLAEREKQATDRGGHRYSNIGQLLAQNRLWQRLVERIKSKYKFDQSKDEKHQSECYSADPAVDNCSCHSVKGEFRRLMEMMERAGEQSSCKPASDSAR